MIYNVPFTCISNALTEVQFELERNVKKNNNNSQNFSLRLTRANNKTKLKRNQIIVLNMETSKLCLICLCEKKQNVLIPFSTQLTDIQNELKAIRGSCHNTHPSNDKMDWSSIEHLKIGEMLVDCSPEKVCNKHFCLANIS